LYNRPEVAAVPSGLSPTIPKNVLGENLHQRHQKIPHERPGLDPRTAAVGSQRLTA
jgi:hypothetical protein